MEDRGHRSPARKRDDRADLIRRLRAARTWLAEQYSFIPTTVEPPNEIAEPYPVPQQTYGWAAGDAAYAMGAYELQPGQALIIDGTSPNCVFWNLCLWNPFLHTYDYTYERVTINGAHVTYEPDGSWRIVVCDIDPGHPNWVSTAGRSKGLIWLRWFLPEETPKRPTCRVVDVAQVAGVWHDRRRAAPQPIRLTDLAQPLFPEAAQPMRDALAGYGSTLALTSEALLANATERTGLTGWGDDGFRERLDVLTASLREEAGLSDVGTAVVFEQLVGNLVNRLRLEALIAEHPEIEDIEIARPIIICGLPRTGTTHLHNLIAADPNMRYLPYWESLEPFPAPGEEDQARRDRCTAGLDLVDASMPEFKRMHDMTVDHAHEEIQLLANDISGMLFETTYYLPSFAAHYKSHDQAPSYAYLKRQLQAMQWLRGAPAGY